MLIPLVFLAGAGARWFGERRVPAGPPEDREGRKRRVLLALLLLGAFGVPLLFSARFLLRGTLGGGYLSPGEARALRALEREARTLIPERAVTASSKPGPVHWLFRRPAVLLPKGLDRRGLERFLRKYRVKALVLGLGSFAGSGGEEYKGFLRGRTRKGPGGVELVVLE